MMLDAHTAETSFLDSLKSPITGGPLKRSHPHLLDDGERQWPLVEGIPYLRVDRDQLRLAVVSAINEGNRTKALALLLTDRKDETVPVLDFKSAVRAATASGNISEVMQKLAYGGMAPYLYHRWCLPSYLSGLALLEAHTMPGMSLFEAGCGIGHFLRIWTIRSGSATGCDLVFSNLWLARRFVVPEANLVCCDLDSSFPLQSHVADISFSQDAFHYFRRKTHAVEEMKRISKTGTVLLGHVHNAAQPNPSPGSPLFLRDYTECILPAAIYRDDYLTKSVLTAVPAKSVETSSDCADAQAFGFATNRPVESRLPWLTNPQPNFPLQLNPLLASGGQWPSAKFKAEFVDDWSYLREMEYPSEKAIAAARAGRANESDVRRQIFLDLPSRWV